jgi:membrane associated rhomboid family serine protease
MNFSAVQNLTVTQVLIASVVVVSVVGFLSDTIQRALVMNPYRVRHGQVWRLLTAGFIHADVVHLALNMFVLYVFADLVRSKLGDGLFVALYLSAVVVAYLPTTVRYWNNPRYSSLGASGAVAAVMLSAILLYPGLKLRILFLPFPVPGVIFGALYILYSVWRSWGSDDNVNHDAHFAGAVYGALVTFLYSPNEVVHSLRYFATLVGL